MYKIEENLVTFLLEVSHRTNIDIKHIYIYVHINIHHTIVITQIVFQDLFLNLKQIKKIM